MKFGLDENAVASIANPMTLGSIDVSKIRRLVITRKNRAVRTMKVSADIAKFIRDHASDQLQSYDEGRLQSAGPGSDYLSLIVNLHS